MLRIKPKSLPVSNSNIINYLTYIFFGVYLLIGINIYKDYGITTDEPFQRTSGYYWYLWIINNFFSDYANFEFLNENFNNMEWSQEFKNGLFLEYGVIFDLFAVFVEDIFNLENVYQKKHLLTFLIFFFDQLFLLLINEAPCFDITLHLPIHKLKKLMQQL